MLGPGGGLALFWNKHVQSDAGGDFFERIQEFYDHIRLDGEETFAGLPRPEDVPETERAPIEASGLFGPVTVRRYVWEQPYSAASYTNLLNTYSDHRAMDAARRTYLFENIAALINQELGGQIVKRYLTLLYVALKR